jgi:hypothetical protein
VNVNAVDANNTSVVQDYALVVSYGDAGVFSNAFTLTDVALVSSNGGSGLGTMTNGAPLLNQRVGGNAQLHLHLCQRALHDQRHHQPVAVLRVHQHAVHDQPGLHQRGVCRV